MSSVETLNVDCVIIGDSLSSKLLSILLSKKRDKVLFLRDNNSVVPSYDQHFSLISLNFLRLHSIPYNELSIKNKSYDSYVERFVTYEKWFISKNLDNKYDFHLFYTFRQFGVINHQLFGKFLSKLMKKENNLIEDSINESFKLIKINKNLDQSNFRIRSAGKEVELPAKKVIVTDTIFRDYLKEKFVSTKIPAIKYQLKINELLSDSVNHYFLGSNSIIKKITIIPCSNFSIIEFYSLEEVMDPFNNEIVSFLENKYDINISELEFQFKESLYLTITPENIDFLYILPANILFSYPIQSNLFTKLEMSFYLSLDIDNETDIKYNDWLKRTLDKYNLVNQLFISKENEQLKLLIIKLIKNKDIAHMNKLSKFLLGIRFKLTFKGKSLILEEFETIIKILSYSEII